MELSNDLVKGAKGAAAYCGLTPHSIYHMVSDGRLPCIRMGKAMFFRKSELDEAFKSQRAS